MSAMAPRNGAGNTVLTHHHTFRQSTSPVQGQTQAHPRTLLQTQTGPQILPLLQSIAGLQQNVRRQQSWHFCCDVAPPVLSRCLLWHEQNGRFAAEPLLGLPITTPCASTLKLMALASTVPTVPGRQAPMSAEADMAAGCGAHESGNVTPHDLSHDKPDPSQFVLGSRSLPTARRKYRQHRQTIHSTPRSPHRSP